MKDGMGFLMPPEISRDLQSSPADRLRPGPRDSQPLVSPSSLTRILMISILTPSPWLSAHQNYCSSPKNPRLVGFSRCYHWSLKNWRNTQTIAKHTCLHSRMATVSSNSRALEDAWRTAIKKHQPMQLTLWAWVVAVLHCRVVLLLYPWWFLLFTTYGLAQQATPGFRRVPLIQVCREQKTVFWLQSGHFVHLRWLWYGPKLLKT